MNNTTHHQPDPLGDIIAEAIAGRIDYDHLAGLIAAKLADRTTPGAATDSAAADPLIEVAVIRKQLGRRGSPMATTTFERRFIHTGLLRYLEGPNRAKRYVDRAAWLRIATEIGKKR